MEVWGHSSGNRLWFTITSFIETSPLRRGDRVYDWDAEILFNNGSPGYHGGWKGVELSRAFRFTTADEKALTKVHDDLRVPLFPRCLLVNREIRNPPSNAAVKIGSDAYLYEQKNPRLNVVRKTKNVCRATHREKTKMSLQLLKWSIQPCNWR